VTSDNALEWGVRQSFLDYVHALDDGRVNMADGAGEGEHGFVFPTLCEYSSDRQNGDVGASRVLRFSGTIAFRGHGGLLWVDVAAPWLEFAGEGDGMLTVAGPRPGTPRQPVARLNGLYREEIAGGFRWRSNEPTLTFEGTYWLGGYYAEGTILSPISARIAQS
jgi:hypothetical protein